MNISAPAKINLFLDVLRRLSDGYHELDTLFQNVTLYDEIALRPARSGIRIRVSGPFRRGVPAGRTNTMFKAAQQVREVLHETGGVHIAVKKNIPCGAGLGGGSADAAAVIRFLPRLFNKKLLPSQEHTIARSIGADVPFFLSGGCARGKGVGDIIKPVSNRSSFWMVMVYPGIPVSTADVYRRMGRKMKTNKKNIHKIIKSVQSPHSVICAVIYIGQEHNLF